MQDITLICTVDGAEYKEYEVLINDEQELFLGKNERDPSEVVGIQPQATFDTFKPENKSSVFNRQPLKSATELSAGWLSKNVPKKKFKAVILKPKINS